MIEKEEMKVANSEAESSDNLDATLQKMNQQLDRMEEADKANEKAKKRLKRKVTSKNITIAILIVIIIILLLRGCGAGGTGVDIKLPDFTVGQEDPVPTTQAVKENPEKLYVTLPVSGDFSVSSANPSITLYNPEENADLFEINFTFLDNEGNVIYQSEFKDGGEKWDVNFKELLPVGENEVKVKISSQYDNTSKAANGSASNIVITVNE